MKKTVLIISMLMIYLSGYAQQNYTDKHIKYICELFPYIFDTYKRVEEYDLEKGDTKVKAYFIMFEPSEEGKDIGDILVESYCDNNLRYNFCISKESRLIYYEEKISPMIEKPIEYLDKLRTEGSLIDWKDYVKSISKECLKEAFDRDFYGEKIYMINKNEIKTDAIKLYPTFYVGISAQYAIEKRRNNKHKIISPFN